VGPLQLTHAAQVGGPLAADEALHVDAGVQSGDRLAHDLLRTGPGGGGRLGQPRAQSPLAVLGQCVDRPLGTAVGAGLHHLGQAVTLQARQRRVHLAEREGAAVGEPRVVLVLDVVAVSWRAGEQRQVELGHRHGGCLHHE
jgi:hypothetical protein